jgi:hypothetical protein
MAQREITATRKIAERRLADLLGEPKPAFADRESLRSALTHLGGLSGILKNGDQRDRAAFYEAVGITGLYKPGANQVILTTSPVGHMVRVGGGT